MPRTVEQNEKIRKNKIDQIMVFAISEYYNKGVRGFEMKEVAKAAGIGKGTLYHYFSTKESLLKAIFRKFIDDSKEITQNYLSKDGPFIQKLYDYMRFQFHHAFENPENIRFYRNSTEELKLVFSENEVATIYEEMSSELGKPLLMAIEGAIGEGELINIEPWKINHILWWTLLGANSYYMALKDTVTNDEIIDELLILSFKGIAKNS